MVKFPGSSEEFKEIINKAKHYHKLKENIELLKNQRKNAEKVS